jgi:biotin carboxylase
LVASKTGYQVREFSESAKALGMELVLATDRCHILEDPWCDDAAPIRFEDPSADIQALGERGPFDGILAVGDGPAKVAAKAAEALGLKFHPFHAVEAACNKFLTRARFRTAGMNVPRYQLVTDPGIADHLAYPLVMKPLRLSGSRGVIRVNTPHEFREAFERIQKIVHGPILVEEFIPGSEFAVEGLMTHGRFHPLAIFDKPDPLDGPFFEETIYLTPSREPKQTQQAILSAVKQAVGALGLQHGPVHAEARVNDRGVWILEAAPRPIGGLCARVLKFADGGLEQLLLRHAAGEDVSGSKLQEGAHGVMMIPIPGSGVYTGTSGVREAQDVENVEDVVITAKEGQPLVPLPEGASYLGFIFSRAQTSEKAENSLRRAYASLRFSSYVGLTIVR